MGSSQSTSNYEGVTLITAASHLALDTSQRGVPQECKSKNPGFDHSAAESAHRQALAANAGDTVDVYRDWFREI